MKKLVDEVNVDINRGRAIVSNEDIIKFDNSVISSPNIGMEFYNKSNIPVKVIDRQGSVFYCIPDPDPYFQRGVYIVKTMMIDNEHSNRMYEKCVTVNSSKELDFYKHYGPRPLVWSNYSPDNKTNKNMEMGNEGWYQNVITNVYNKYSKAKYRKTVYFIPIENIKDDIGFYDELTDLLVAFGHENKTPVHPYSIVHDRHDYFFEKLKEDSKDKVSHEGYSLHVSEKDKDKRIPELYKRSGNGIVRLDAKEESEDYESGRLYLNWDELDDFENVVTKTDSIMLFNKTIPNYKEEVLEPWLAKYGIFTSKDKVRDSHKAVDDIYKRIVELRKISLEDKKIDNEMVKEELRFEYEKDKHGYLKEELSSKKSQIDDEKEERDFLWKTRKYLSMINFSGNLISTLCKSAAAIATAYIAYLKFIKDKEIFAT